MARKTLKQKLKSQIRLAKEDAAFQHEQAGIVINYELQKVQAIALGHGVMATLLEAKKHFDVESEKYKEFEKICQARIGQCFAQLVAMGIDSEEVQRRLTQGH